MIEIQTLVLGENQTNCYIVKNGGCADCAVIDPGYTPARILSFLEQNRLSCKAILLTHGHFDHVGGVRGLAEATGCPVYLCEKELSMPTYLTAGPLYYTDGYGEGDSLTVAGISFTVLETPGHTPGSVCLSAEGVLFTGDTLFEGCCGRMDLPGGSPKDMRRSMARLNALEGDCAVYPGHGSATTLSHEKSTNPYLRKRL